MDTHIITERVGNELVRLRPEQGYTLKDTVTGRCYSEAYVSERRAEKFKAERR